MMNTIEIMKKLDDLVGPILMGFLPGRSRLKKPLKKSGRILVIRPGGLGDAILLLPAVKLIKETICPDQIDVLCEPRNKSVFKACPSIDRIYSYQSPLDMIRILGSRYDVVMDTEQSHFLTAVITGEQTLPLLN